MKNFIENDHKYDIKLFKINMSYHELAKIEHNSEKIKYIIDSHISHFEIEDNLYSISKHSIEDLKVLTYVYNEPEKNSYWKQFLPDNITDKHSFEIKKISFALFVTISDKIFCVVGGGGISVIKKFLNHTFGIDLYEHIADLTEDKISSITLRSISGKLTEERDIYRNGQNLSDSINFTEIPKKINLELRNTLKKNIFNFIQYSNDRTLVEVSTYFHIKQRIDFETFIELIKTIYKIEKNIKPISISSFSKEKDDLVIKNEYQNTLLNEIYDYMIDSFGPNRLNTVNKFDIDFIHPSKILEFYECDTYKLYTKNKRNAFYETNDMYTLFENGLKHIYEIIGENLNNPFEFNKILFGIKVVGIKNEKRLTTAMFLQHITCEVKYQNQPVFKIDNIWYTVQDNFETTLNEKCINLLNQNYLNSNILDYSWDTNKLTEGDYNLKYNNQDNYLVLDKMISQNIELCDIIHYNGDDVFLIHVKNGFDAKMRDLSNQISISANRLFTDYNSKEKKYLKAVYDRYIKGKKEYLPQEKFLSLFGKNIIYVMAYKSRFEPKLTLDDRITKSKSNIAKYSLIQANHDLKNLYQLKYFDIK